MRLPRLCLIQVSGEILQAEVTGKRDDGMAGSELPREANGGSYVHAGRRAREDAFFTRHAPGTKENPLDTERVNEKARNLIAPILGAAKTEQLIARIHAIERLANVRELMPLLT